MIGIAFSPWLAMLINTQYQCSQLNLKQNSHVSLSGRREQLSAVGYSLLKFKHFCTKERMLLLSWCLTGQIM